MICQNAVPLPYAGVAFNIAIAPIDRNRMAKTSELSVTIMSRNARE
jgi:hypothetical protein